MSTAQLSAEISHDDGPVFLATLTRTVEPNGSNLQAATAVHNIGLDARCLDLMLQTSSSRNGLGRRR
jgi:hypothetical protein